MSDHGSSYSGTGGTSSSSYRTCSGTCGRSLRGCIRCKLRFACRSARRPRQRMTMEGGREWEMQRARTCSNRRRGMRVQSIGSRPSPSRKKHCARMCTMSHTHSGTSASESHLGNPERAAQMGPAAVRGPLHRAGLDRAQDAGLHHTHAAQPAARWMHARQNAPHRAPSICTFRRSSRLRECAALHTTSTCGGVAAAPPAQRTQRVAVAGRVAANTTRVTVYDGILLCAVALCDAAAA